MHFRNYQNLMSTGETPLRPNPPLDRDSEVRPISELRVVFDLSYAHPNVLNAVREAIADARRELENAIANDDGQGLLFPEMTDDQVRVPVEWADKIIKKAQATLAGRNVRLVKTDKAIKIVAGEEGDDNPYSSRSNR